MRQRRIAGQGITNASYETMTGKSRSPEVLRQQKKFLRLLDDEQRAVGARYRVRLQVKSYGDVLVPFFSYERKSDIEIRTEQTLQRVQNLLEGRKL